MATIHDIALTLTPGIGCGTARQVIDLCGSAEALFAMSHSQLAELFGSHTDIIDNIERRTAMPRAEQEMAFITQHGIRPLFFTDADFPQRLNSPETADCPALLYVLGNADLNAERTVSMVGTRRSTQYGRDNCGILVEQLLPLAPTIVSGLAYGIDTASHAAAVERGLPTVAVLGHGLDRIYPQANRRLAERIVHEGGALVTEFPSGTAINPGNFPARNRIIAALGDATVVVEASEKGGALITAALAGSYHRDVFAVPGRLSDTASRGTNNLIATNKALLLRNADDIAYQLGWPLPGKESRQQDLFPVLSPDEQAIVDLFHKNPTLTLDELVVLTGHSLAKVAGLVFNLEMQKTLRALPGRLYELAR